MNFMRKIRKLNRIGKLILVMVFLCTICTFNVKAQQLTEEKINSYWKPLGPNPIKLDISKETPSSPQNNEEMIIYTPSRSDAATKQQKDRLRVYKEWAEQQRKEQSRQYGEVQKILTEIAKNQQKIEQNNQTVFQQELKYCPFKPARPQTF